MVSLYSAQPIFYDKDPSRPSESKSDATRQPNRSEIPKRVLRERVEKAWDRRLKDLQPLCSVNLLCRSVAVGYVDKKILAFSNEQLGISEDRRKESETGGERSSGEQLLLDMSR